MCNNISIRLLSYAKMYHEVIFVIEYFSRACNIQGVPKMELLNRLQRDKN